MSQTGSERKSLRAVRSFCLECQGGLSLSVRECKDVSCALYTWRLPDAESPNPEGDRAVRGIRRHCMTCAENRAEIRRCNAGEGCVLWPYRFGVMPETYRRVMRRIRTPKDLWLPGFG